MKSHMTTVRRIAFGVILFAVFAFASGFGGCPTAYNPFGGGSSPNPGTVVATPNPLAFQCPNDGTFSVSQIYYSGSFTASGVDGTKITVTATSPPNTFLVHAVSGATFSTSFVVTGGGGQQATEMINFTGCPCVRHHDMWQRPREKTK